MDIVILHGWNLSKDRYAPLAKILHTAGHRIHMLDFPGFGKTPAPKDPWHVVDYAEFLHSWMKTKRIRLPVLIGHSFGGRVALVYAHEHPSAVAALVLTGAPGFSPAPGIKRAVFWLVAKTAKLLFVIPPFSFFRRSAQVLLYRVTGSREFLRAEGTMKQTFKNVVADPLLPAMQSVRVPCLLLWGEKDTMVPLEVAQRMKQVMPHATLSVIPDADHGVPIREPDRFAKEVELFLKTL